MTGFGEASSQSEGLTLTVEVCAVNNRHLKITVRGSEPYPMLEPELEKVVRKFIRRGTILIHIRADRTMGSHEGVVHAKVLATTSPRCITFVNLPATPRVLQPF